MQKDTEALDKIGRSIRFYAALGLVTAATLMLQIIETRIISVTSWYHLAFFVISIAMFGLTAGAIFVYLRKERFRPERLSVAWSEFTLCLALPFFFSGIVVSLAVTRPLGHQPAPREELVRGNAMSASHQAYRHARLERLLDDPNLL
jgi:hypothetical protein